jgi:hypothetical protein
MVSAFSTAAGAAASDIEDYAARSQLEEAVVPMAQLTRMGEELLRATGDLWMESLQRE